MGSFFYAGAMLLVYAWYKLYLECTDQKFTAGWAFATIFWPVCFPIVVAMSIYKLKRR